MCSLEHVQQNVGNILVTVCSLHRILLVYLHIVGRPFSGAGPLTRVPTRLATGHTFDHSRLKNMASERRVKILDGLCLRKIILKCLDYFVSPQWGPHIDGSSPHTLSTQMFPNLDHFVWELSVSKTSVSPCVGIENPLFITLHLPSPFSQMSSHDVENTLRKMNQLEFRLGKVRKSNLIQSLKFLSFLTDVTTTGIESPTAAKMSQPKTISHKVFPIPHYLTTWPSDYLTIWRLFDYLVTGWREVELCKARVGSWEGTLIIPMTDCPLPTLQLFVGSPIFLHIWPFS